MPNSLTFFSQFVEQCVGRSRVVCLSGHIFTKVNDHINNISLGIAKHVQFDTESLMFLWNILFENQFTFVRNHSFVQCQVLCRLIEGVIFVS